MAARIVVHGYTAVDVVIVVDAIATAVLLAAVGAPRRRITRLLIAALVLRAVTTQMTDLATAVAALIPSRTVPRDMSALVTVVTGHVHLTLPLIWTVACQMASLITVVAA